MTRAARIDHLVRVVYTTSRLTSQSIPSTGKDTVNTPERILQVAMRLFAKNGYHSCTVDDIAREAGVAKGTVYWHFSSKESLFEALLEHILRQYINQLKAIVNTDASVLAQLREIVLMRTRFVETNPHFQDLMLSLWEQGVTAECRRRLLGWRRQHHRVISDLMRKGVGTGELAMRSPELAAKAFVGMVDELMLHCTESQHDDLVESVMEFLVHGITRRQDPEAEEVEECVNGNG